jgi:transposase
LPIARLAGPELEVRLLVDHRERLVAQRTQLINDLRWHLHDLSPELEIPARVLRRPLAGPHWRPPSTRRADRSRGSLAMRLRRIRELTRSVDAIERELAGSSRRWLNRCWMSAAAACSPRPS